MACACSTGVHGGVLYITSGCCFVFPSVFGVKHVYSGGSAFSSVERGRCRKPSKGLIYMASAAGRLAILRLVVSLPLTAKHPSFLETILLLLGDHCQGPECVVRGPALTVGTCSFGGADAGQSLLGSLAAEAMQ